MSHIVTNLSHPSLEKAAEMVYQTAMSELGRILAANFYQTPDFFDVRPACTGASGQAQVL